MLRQLQIFNAQQLTANFFIPVSPKHLRAYRIPQVHGGALRETSGVNRRQRGLGEPDKQDRFDLY